MGRPALPLRGKQAQWAAGIEERKELVDRATAYVTLYGSYTECEAIYGVERLLVTSPPTPLRLERGEVRGSHR